ncbi:hypothetical protein, partial [Helicobacter sp. MIT 14-3879]|uniref:hypothetical protein n=1 Tax=Helicobacter sp. MIT 14-3879 TaxID=2040649 RepID=UPI001C6A4BCE
KFIGIALPLTDLTEEQCLMKDDILGVMQKCYNEVQQIHNIIPKVDIGKPLDAAQYTYDYIKEVLNGCK